MKSNYIYSFILFIHYLLAIHLVSRQLDEIGLGMTISEAKMKELQERYAMFEEVREKMKNFQAVFQIAEEKVSLSEKLGELIKTSLRDLAADLEFVKTYWQGFLSKLQGLKELSTSQEDISQKAKKLAEDTVPMFEEWKRVAEQPLKLVIRNPYL